MTSLHDFIPDPRMKGFIVLGVFLSPVVALIEKYLFDDWQFLFFFMVLVGVDTVTGFLKYFLLNRVNSSAWGKFGKKVVGYGSFLIVIHVLTNYTDNAAAKFAFAWIEQAGYAALVVRESISIIENVGVIFPGLLPAWILKRLKGFDENGKFIEDGN